MRAAIVKSAETSPSREPGTKPAPAASPLAHLQRAVGNQAMLRAMSGGAPLPRELRSSLESYFKTPFDRVRVHTGQSSQSFADAVGARAFTVGQDIHLGSDGARAAKLKVGAAGDAFEREADRVADEVMKAPEPRMQRKCGCGGSCGDCSKDDEPEPVRRKSFSNESIDGVEDFVGGRGTPLDASTRAFMESRFGHDFARVRVHTGTDAAESAASLKARAYTVGRDIVFGAGEYRPHTEDGQRLLAHELTHMMQQSDGNGARVQRKMKLTSPMALAPWPKNFMGPPPPTRAVALQIWLDQLCDHGMFIVNPLTGAVTSAAQGSFCRTTRKTGCRCLCTATSTDPGSKDIEIQIDEKMTYFKSEDSSGVAMEEKVDLAGTGGGATGYPTTSSAVVGMRGRTNVDLGGVGDTSPKQPGTGSRDQVLRTPDWLVFGHELCGHALLQTERSVTSHLVTAEGDRSATDVENQLRRERSTVTDSIGIRHGVFLAELVQGWKPVWMEGAAFRVGARDTLDGIAERAGIPASSMLDRIYRFNGTYGTRIAEETKNTIAPGDELLIEDISWHTVIEGETVTSIAEIWNIPPASLRRANPKITASKSGLRPGTRLLIPAS